MDVLSAILGTILAMLGLIVFSLQRLWVAVKSGAKIWYVNLGKRKFLFINYGSYLQYKVRQFYENAGEIFKDETPEERAKAVQPHIERDLQKRKREVRKQNLNERT